MKLFRFAAFAAMAFSMLMLASCNEKNDKPEVIIPVEVYFSADNGSYCYYVAPGASTNVEIKLVRPEATTAETFAIKVNGASNGMSIPESVSFAVGQTEATLTIATPSGNALDKYDFDISLTGENVLTSASSEIGTLRCEGTVYVYEEVTAVGSFGGSAFDYLGYFKQKVWRLADNKMIFKGLLGSDEDLSFTYSSTFGDYGYSIDAVEFSNKDYECKWDDEEYSPGSSYYYFYKAIDDENGEYHSFAPKGDQRYIDQLGFYLGNCYSSYYKTDSSDYVFFTCHYVNFTGESEGIDKGFSWLYYLYFTFVSEEKLANYDFVSFPELTVSQYPEANTDVEAGEGEAVLNLSFYYEGINMDSQVAKVEAVEGGTKYTVSDLWYSGATVSFTVNNDGTISVDAGDDGYLDADGNYYFYNTTANDYLYFYWGSDYDKCISSLTIIDPSNSEYNYCGEGYAYLNVSLSFWNGSDWSETIYDYLSITW